ncbi:hypothetical protein K1W54_12360 [Micromonospora sp. CPCC 205371]|nr:hypothetical protein [Micromonospora sp. CPCC 205371]
MTAPRPPGPGAQPSYPLPPPGKKGLGTGAIVAIVIGGVIVLLCVIVMAGSILTAVLDADEPTTRVSEVAPLQPATSQPAAPTTNAPPAPQTATATPTTRAGPATSFGDGTWIVGEDIAAGQYRAAVPQDSFGCYWARLKDTSGSFDAIIANHNAEPGTQTVVTIAPTDKAFQSRGCGSWRRD